MNNDVDALLTANGWTLRRQRNHNIWACPCGEHLVTMGKTSSDHRAYMNKLQELRKLECPSLAHVIPPSVRDKSHQKPKQRKKKYRPKPKPKVRQQSRERIRHNKVDFSLGGNLEIAMTLDSLFEDDPCRRKGSRIQRGA